MLLMFLWACKHFYSKHISCKMLKPHSTKEQEGHIRFKPTARRWERRPHSEQASYPAPGWACEIHRQNQTSKMRGEEGIVLFF